MHMYLRFGPSIANKSLSDNSLEVFYSLRDLIKLIFIYLFIFAHANECVPRIRKTVVRPSTLKGGFICPFTEVQWIEATKVQDFSSECWDMEASREGTVAPPVSPRSVTMALLSLKLKGGLTSRRLLEAACSIQGGRFLSPRDLVCCEFFIDRWCLKHSSTKKNLLS